MALTTCPERKQVMTAFLDQVSSCELRDAELCDEDEVIAVCKLWNLVKGFIADFSQRTIEKIEAFAIWPKIKSANTRANLVNDPTSLHDTSFLKTIHPNELARLQRGFFRFELICRVVRPRQIYTQTFSPRLFKKMLRSLFPRWQVEELATVWDYLRNQYLHVRHEWSAACISSLPRPAQIEDILNPYAALVTPGDSVSIDEFPTEDNGRFTAPSTCCFGALPGLGLAFFSKLLHQDPQTRHDTLRDLRHILAPWKSRSSHWVGPQILVDLLWLQVNVVRDRDAYLTQQCASFGPDHWNAGWTLYTRWYNNSDLRRAGVIFWEFKRLFAILCLPKETYKAHKIVSARPDLRLANLAMHPHPLPLLPVSYEHLAGWFVLKDDWEAFERAWGNKTYEKEAREEATVKFLQGLENPERA